MPTLVNADFEGNFTERGAGEVKVAAGWEPWWHQTDTRPEYKRADHSVDAHRVHGGYAAQQWFNSYATHTAGIYQRVTGLTPGVNLTLSAWVQAFTRNDDTNWRVSDGRYRMRIGIDPYGGTDPESKDVVWSETLQPYDKWYRLEVTTPAKSDRATVFVWGQPEWRVKHNNGYVDDVVLTVGEGEPPPLPPGEPGDYVTAAQAHTIALHEASQAIERFRQHLLDTIAGVVGSL
jgi:hypothetical protein